MVQNEDKIGPTYGKQIRRLLLLFFFWVLIIPKWLTNDSGHIAILFGTFSKVPKKLPHIDPQAPYLLQK